MKKKSSHSKIKNTGILYELLTRQITTDILNNDTKSPALQIFKEAFNKNSELYKEWSLYNVLLTKKYDSESRADFLIETVVTNRRKQVNEKALKREKYNVIKAIKESFNVEKFFGCKIPNYKLYASIYRLFESAEMDISPVEVVDCRTSLAEHICGEKKSLIAPVLRGLNKSPELMEGQEKDIKLLAYRIMIHKFNEKYAHLNDDQKLILREYINNITNTTAFDKNLRNQVLSLKKDFATAEAKVTDIPTKIKLSEVKKMLDKISDAKQLSESNVISLLLYHELLKEIKEIE